MKTSILILASLILSDPVVQAADGSAQRFVGQWIGEAETVSERTGLILRIDSIEKEVGVTMTLPDVGVMGWPAKQVCLLEKGTRWVPAAFVPVVITANTVSIHTILSDFRHA